MYHDETQQMNDWSFPEIDVPPLPTFDMEGEAETESDNAKVIRQADEAAEKAASVNQSINAAALIELDNLKREYEARINILNNLLNKLKNPTSILDEELIELIQDIVRKIAKKIICREIETDKTLLPQMINELKALIDAKNGILSINLSQADYARLEAEQNQLSNLMSVDSNLQVGDIIVKSNFAEVRAVLNDRIEQLIRIQHD